MTTTAETSSERFEEIVELFRQPDTDFNKLVAKLSELDDDDLKGLVIWAASELAATRTLEAFEPEPVAYGWQIVVLQRGWVVVGAVTRCGDELVIEQASVIRYWGTTRGLGELRDGPTSKTKLDPAGTVRAHALAVVLTIDVDASKWQG